MPLTIQYIPYEELSNLDTDKKIQKLLRVVKQNRVILMEGRLSANEEADLIEETMNVIDSKFKGIEISTFNPLEKNNKQLQDKIKQVFLNLFLGNRRGLTVIGPANVIKEIRRDPNKMQLFLSNRRR